MENADLHNILYKEPPPSYEETTTACCLPPPLDEINALLPSPMCTPRTIACTPPPLDTHYVPENSRHDANTSRIRSLIDEIRSVKEPLICDRCKKYSHNIILTLEESGIVCKYCYRVLEQLGRPSWPCSCVIT